MDLSSTADSLRNQIYSAKRELRFARQSEGLGEAKDGKIAITRIKQRLTTLRLMLKTVEERQEVNIPKFPSPVKPAFQSSSKRIFQQLPKMSTVPNFYKANHDWQFGYESRCRTIEMDSFDFSLNDKQDREDEILNNPDVLVGLVRPQSRYRDTDFFGLSNKAIFKSHMPPPRVPANTGISDCGSTLGSLFSSMRSPSPPNSPGHSATGSLSGLWSPLGQRSRAASAAPISRAGSRAASRAGNLSRTNSFKRGAEVKSTEAAALPTLSASKAAAQL